jgi:Glycosyl hydrolase family 26
LISFLLVILLGDGNASLVRRKADSLLAASKFQAASEMYAKASAMYNRLGDPNAGKVLRETALRYNTSVRVFIAEPAPTSPARLAKFEPAIGCYVGANIEREEATRDPQAFNNLVGKHHALFFRYRKYGVPFPTAEARYLSHAHSGMQIAFEPSRLSDVRDDRYLRQFASDARQSGIPIFIRFASEMNGSWTPYHDDPQAYIAAFRLVARVMHKTAPNVAMVWCPNEIPEVPIDRYYPGVDAVDWVGVNFYSVIYNDADRSRGAEWRWPTDQVAYVYNKYAARHPIMVGEWAASHRSTMDRYDRPDFASLKIQQFYRTAPLLYPRLKAISWLSFNALKYAQGDRQLNNYSLYDSDAVAKAYGQSISDTYFVDRIGGQASVRWRELRDLDTIPPGAKLAVYVRSYQPVPTLESTIDGDPRRDPVIGRIDFTGPASGGSTRLSFRVIDGQNRLALAKSLTLKVLDPSAP